MLLKKLSLLPCLNLSRKSSSLKMVKVSQTCSINQFVAIDYKATLCPYFKAGVCEKGKKCKYSHDMTIEQAKLSNIDIYADPRAKIGKVPDTIITCNHFIEAVEKDLYGFNWICPNKGDDCNYRHMLPQGYILQRDKKKEDEQEDDGEKLTFEEQIEEERKALPSAGLTPVTPESFAAWKERRAARRQEELEAKIKAEQAKGKKDIGQMKFMSGRALFSYNPELFKDDDEETKDTDENFEEIKEEAKAEDEFEESKDEEVKVDQDLFKDEGGNDEDVDFGDDQ